MMFDRNAPFNDLPTLPPKVEVETAAILKKAFAASRAPAELKGLAERMPNQAMLIDSLVPSSHVFVWTTCPPQEAGSREGAPGCRC